MSHFTLDEWRCHCHRPECDALAQPQQELWDRLDLLRDKIGLPIVIRSGLRCAYWNLHEGGEEASGHVTGHDADLGCPTSSYRWLLLTTILAWPEGPLFPRLGIGKTFLHVGIPSELPQQVIWTY